MVGYGRVPWCETETETCVRERAAQSLLRMETRNRQPRFASLSSLRSLLFPLLSAPFTLASLSSPRPSPLLRFPLRALHPLPLRTLHPPLAEAGICSVSPAPARSKSARSAAHPSCTSSSYISTAEVSSVLCAAPVSHARARRAALLAPPRSFYTIHNPFACQLLAFQGTLHKQRQMCSTPTPHTHAHTRAHGAVVPSKCTERASQGISPALC